MKTRLCIIVMLFTLLVNPSLTFSQKEVKEAETVSLNFSTFEELIALPGITPELAERIIKGRPYSTVDALLKSKELRDLILQAFITQFDMDKLNVNKASQEQLQGLPGVTPEIAKAIILKRPYLKLEELAKKVDGLTEEKVSELQAYLDVIDPKKDESKRGRDRKLRQLPLLPGTPP